MTLGVYAAGAFTSVGMNVGQTAGSIATRLQRFKTYGDGIVGALCPVAETVTGVRRLHILARAALYECGTACSTSPLPLVLCLAEDAVDGARDLGDAELHHGGWGNQLLHALCVDHTLPIASHHSRVFSTGRGAVGQALDYAADLIASGSATGCHILGVDSWWAFPRTKSVLPGEAAACVTVGGDWLLGSQFHGVLAHIDGWNAQYTPEFFTDAASATLANVIHGALAMASQSPQHVHCVMHDRADDRVALRDIVLALTRVGWPAATDQVAAVSAQPWSPAVSVGDVGAASGPLLMAYLSFMMQMRHASVGTRALQLDLSDSGLHSAIVVSAMPCVRGDHARDVVGTHHG